MVTTTGVSLRELVVQSNPRKGSQAMISGTPITPPMSPIRGERDGDTISLDTTSTPLPTDSEDGMDIEQEKPASAPLRHLEDEEEHLHKGGTLRLTDFEVRGTLGSWTADYQE